MVYCVKCRKDVPFKIGTINHPDLGVVQAYICDICGAQVHKDLQEPNKGVK